MTRATQVDLPARESGSAAADPHIFVDPRLLAAVLRPYKDDCRYLRSATMTTTEGLAVAHGEFAIPYSCYIADTGHFNAVEFNICYNQLMYYLIAHAIQEKTIPVLARWTLDDYWARQLPGILIATHRSAFRAQVDSSSFRGKVAITAITERKVRNPMLIVETTCRFWDGTGGQADGEVRLVLLDPPAGQLAGTS